MRIGIIGLPQVGKTTLFNLLTEAGASTGFGSRDKANVGVANVPDERIDYLSSIYQPRKTTYAQIEFIDIAGFGPGSNGRDTKEFLSALQNVDALVQVVRAFKSEVVPHVLGSIDVMRDVDLLQSELVLTDLSLLETRLERLTKGRVKGKDSKLDLELLEKCRTHLEAEKPLTQVEFTQEEADLLRQYTFYTAIPMVLVVNLDEDQLAAAAYEKHTELAAWAADRGMPLIPICGKLEEEITALAPEERAPFLKDLGLEETGIARLAKTVYSHLGLISYFTVGKDEVRAWTIKAGTNAKQAAGKIHSDIERGFIRAEVVGYEDFKQVGSMTKAKEKGLCRLEGKEYVVKDGDIISFRFNV
ncbi:MAG TPA: redox-regulated ATPase YchF [Firmicutes bacterium]|nr:redox-regulated ATPase YchF [Bacillota bacterium]